MSRLPPDVPRPRGGWGSHPFYAGLLSNLLRFILTRLGAILALAGLLVLVVEVAYCRSKEAEATSAKAAAALARAQVEAVTRELHGVQGRLIKEREAKLTPVLATFVAAVKKADPRAHVDSVSALTVTVKDEAPGRVTETFVEDAHHRFRFDLPSGLLHREQKFKLDLVTLRDVDGTYRVQKAEFREFDPKTGEEIPSTGAELGATFSFVEAPRQAGPGPWHLRGIAAVAYPWGVGGGVEVNPYKKLTLSGLLLYQPGEKAIVAAIGAGYRLLNSTVGVGPYIGVSSRGGSFVGGVAATIEVTR